MEGEQLGESKGGKARGERSFAFMFLATLIEFCFVYSVASILYVRSLSGLSLHMVRARMR